MRARGNAFIAARQYNCCTAPDSRLFQPPENVDARTNSEPTGRLELSTGGLRKRLNQYLVVRRHSTGGLRNVP
jgi:hypothetical protein